MNTESDVEVENKVEELIRENLRFLQKMCKFLNLLKEPEHVCVMASELGEILSDRRNPNEYVFLNVKNLYETYTSELEKNSPDGNPPNINLTIIESFSNCLLYIIDRLRDQNANLQETFKHFLDLQECIVVFSTTTVVLDTRKVRNLLNTWINDLLMIITGGDGEIKKTPEHLRIFNAIKQILVILASCDIYCEIIVREITRRFSNVLTYHDSNDAFGAYIAEHTWVFEYLLWILKEIGNGALRRGYRILGDKKICYVLKKLDRCLKGKSSAFITNLIEDVLRVL